MRSKSALEKRLRFYKQRIEGLEQHYKQALSKPFKARDKAYLRFLLNEISVYQSICDELKWVLS